MEYVRGVVDGIVWTQGLDHAPHLCFVHDGSYLEISDGYVDYLLVMAAKPDPYDWLSKANMFILEDFLGSRYGCSR
jgi:hypothetical protein